MTKWFDDIDQSLHQFVWDIRGWNDCGNLRIDTVFATSVLLHCIDSGCIWY